uniref:CHK kinase-like domain-containing protein n=1 Tax=Panagrolaimus sp. JU765 TaxID=591449 RepID=A0AC34QCB7_9BILA
MNSSPKYFYVYAFFDAWKDLKMEPVVVHGDFWGGNIMWKTDRNGDTTNDVAAFVDWQLAYEGSAMADFARVLTLCTDGDVRRTAESQFFDKYLELLTKECKSVGLECPFTLQQIEDSYYYMFLVQGLTCPVLVTMLAPLCCANLSEKVKKAKIDGMILRCKHIWEDIDELLSGKFKHVFEKYGQ